MKQGQKLRVEQVVQGIHCKAQIGYAILVHQIPVLEQQVPMTYPLSQPDLVLTLLV